jgi:hypothetical protein
MPIYIGPSLTLTNSTHCTLMASGTAGVVTLTCYPPAIVPDTVTIGASGKISFDATFGAINQYTITAVLGGETDTCVIEANTDKCLVYGTIVDVLGNPLRNSEIYIEPIQDGPSMSIVAIKVYTNHEGYFSIQLLRDIEVVLNAKDAAYNKRITVPNANSVDIKDL